MLTIETMIFELFNKGLIYSLKFEDYHINALIKDTRIISFAYKCFIYIN